MVFFLWEDGRWGLRGGMSLDAAIQGTAMVLMVKKDNGNWAGPNSRCFGNGLERERGTQDRSRWFNSFFFTPYLLGGKPAGLLGAHLLFLAFVYFCPLSPIYPRQGPCLEIGRSTCASARKGDGFHHCSRLCCGLRMCLSPWIRFPILPTGRSVVSPQLGQKLGFDARA